MYYYAIIFFIMAIVAGAFSITGMLVSKISYIVFVLSVIFLVISGLFYLIHQWRKPQDPPPFTGS